MKFSEYPFLRYALFFIMGVLIYPYLGVFGLEDIVYFTSGLFILYLILVLLNSFQKNYRFKPLFPLLAYALLVSMGILFTYLKDAKNDPSHLLFQNQVVGYLGEVEDLDQKKPNTFANRIKIRYVKKGEDYVPASGEVIIYHKLPEQLLPGEIVWIEGNPTTIVPPKNPYEFDYQEFLANQQIYHSHYVGTQITRIGKINHQPINNFVLQLRASILDRIDRHISTPHSNQIAKALLLGQKKNLEEEVSEAYITAGTMHILAVSGLHVGIVYGFFFLFIKPYQLPARKRILYLSLLILIIWMYALITGMSPSVMRAAAMFTLMGLAQMKSRSPSIYNALALSALILLVFDPFILYTVGFQLSYLAVFGIVLLQSKISGLWEPRNKIVHYFWEITSVGIAAQLATFPVSVHYFHVFPTYFIFSNLVAIPAAFLVMSFGIPFMLISFVEPIGYLLGSIVDFFIRMENGVIFSIQNLPYARIDHIRFPPVEMLLFWLFIVTLYLLVQENKKRYAYLSMLVLLGLVLSNWIYLWKDYQRNELYIYGVEKGLAVDHFYRGQLYSRIDGISSQDISYKIHPNRISKGYMDSKALEYWEEGSSIHLLLPEQYSLKINGEQFEIERSSIKSVSQYVKGKWLAMDLKEDQVWDANTYRIVLK
ncbi:MAG: ComEC/Rec2 family competence protein [Anditalea sp.]